MSDLLTGSLRCDRSPLGLAFCIAMAAALPGSTILTGLGMLLIGFSWRLIFRRVFGAEEPDA